MKTNTYILLILLLSFSFGIAQSNTDKIKEGKVMAVSVNAEEVTVSKDNAVVKTVKENNDAVLIDAKELRESIARTSDIRHYLNRVRNVENIRLLFPKINKPVKA